MKPALILLTAAAIASPGCRSKTQPPDPCAPEDVAQILGTPAEIPEDWPLTREEHDLLTFDSRNRSARFQSA